jgi:hypothetical protein
MKRSATPLEQMRYQTAPLPAAPYMHRNISVVSAF